MSRTAVGAITIADVADGGSPISAILTNENHTFAANYLGTVHGTEMGVFSSLVKIFLGTTLGVFKSTTVTTATADHNKFSIGTITSSASSWTTAVHPTTGAITVTGIPAASTTNTSTILSVPITVNDTSSSLKTVTMSLSLSKSIAGAGGQIVQMTATKQHFQYDEFATLAPSGQANIIMNLATQGAVGTLTATKSLDGGSFTTLAVGAGAGAASSIDVDGTGAADSIVITPANFGASNTMTIKVSGAAGGSDSVSIVRIRDGVRGASALNVDVKSSDGNIFKNNTGANKTLTCEIIDQIDGSEITHVGTGTGQTSVHYNWQRVDAGGSVSDVLVVDNNDQLVSSTGTSADGLGRAFIVVGAEDVANNSSTQFSCEVTVTDN